MDYVYTCMFIALTGTLGAGKDTVAQYLVTQGWQHISLSDALRGYVAEKGLPSTREELTRAGNYLRFAYGAGVLAERALKLVDQDHVVFSSIRHAREAAVLVEHGALVVAVDADIRIRYDRIVQRARAGEELLSFEQFEHQQQADLSGKGHLLQTGEVMRMAAYTLTNDEGVEQLLNQVDQLLDMLRKQGVLS